MRTIKTILLLLIASISLMAAPVKKMDTIVEKEIKVINKEMSAAQKDSILYEKLSADQLLELKQQEANLERQRMEADSRTDMPLNGFGVVMVVFIPFAFVVLVIIILGRIKNQESQRRYDLYNKSLEMGQAIPEHFFEEPEKKNTISNLKKGILWLSAGLAIVVSCLVVNEKDALFLGIIPSFIGVGYLLVHFLDKPKAGKPE